MDFLSAQRASSHSDVPSSKRLAQVCIIQTRIQWTRQTVERLILLSNGELIIDQRILSAGRISVTMDATPSLSRCQLMYAHVLCFEHPVAQDPAVIGFFHSLIFPTHTR